MPCLRLKRQIKSSLPNNKQFLSWNVAEPSECRCRMWKECEGNYSNTGMLHFTTLVFFSLFICSHFNIFSSKTSFYIPFLSHKIGLFWPHSRDWVTNPHPNYLLIWSYMEVFWNAETLKFQRIKQAYVSHYRLLKCIVRLHHMQQILY